MKTSKVIKIVEANDIEDVFTREKKIKPSQIYEEQPKEQGADAIGFVIDRNNE